MLGNEKLGPTTGNARATRRERPVCDQCPQPATRVQSEKKFFIWIRHNPLKSPDSAKGIQGNARIFAWIYLVLFGFTWHELAPWLYSRTH
jgi:hypothetical protein